MMICVSLGRPSQLPARLFKVPAILGSLGRVYGQFLGIPTIHTRHWFSFLCSAPRPPFYLFHSLSLLLINRVWSTFGCHRKYIIFDGRSQHYEKKFDTDRCSLFFFLAEGTAPQHDKKGGIHRSVGRQHTTPPGYQPHAGVVSPLWYVTTRLFRHFFTKSLDRGTTGVPTMSKCTRGYTSIVQSQSWPY